MGRVVKANARSDARADARSNAEQDTRGGVADGWAVTVVGMYGFGWVCVDTLVRL